MLQDLSWALQLGPNSFESCDVFMRKHGFVWGVFCVFFSEKRILGSPHRWENKVMGEYICNPERNIVVGSV